MVESENTVAETGEKIFADFADAQTINNDKKGAWKTLLWQALTEAGLPLSWVSGKIAAVRALLSPKGSAC